MPTPSAPSAWGSLTSGGSLNNIDWRQFGMAVNILTTPDMPPIKTRQVERSGAHGRYIFPEYYDARPVIISGRMAADSASGLLSNIDALKTFLDSFRGDRPRRLRVIDPVLTDRFYACYFAGVASFAMVGPRTRARMADFTLSLLADPPFAQATALTTVTVTSPSADNWQSITTGTFASDARYIIKGAATNPKIIVGDTIFIWDANLTTDLEGIERNTVSASFSGSAAQKAALFSPSSAGLGFSFLANGSYTLSWSVKGNKAAGTYFFIVEPQFAATTSGTFVVFEHRYDANNYIQLLYYNFSLTDLQRKWIFIKKTGGTLYYVVSEGTQNFVSGDVLKFGLSFGTTGMQLFVNGTLNAAIADTTALSNHPTTLTLHANGSNFSANCKIHKMAGWASELTANEHALISSDPDEHIKNRNQVLEYTGSLDTGDLLDFKRADQQYIGKLFDVSVGGAPSTVWPDDGAVIPYLPQENTAIYFATAMAQLDVQYRKTYL